MLKCPRCGERYDMTRVGQVRCPRCEAEVRTLTAPKAEPSWQPTWRRRPFGKVLDHGRGRAVA